MKFSYKKTLADRAFISIVALKATFGLIMFGGAFGLGIDIDHPHFWTMMIVATIVAILFGLACLFAPILYNRQQRKKADVNRDIVSDAMKNASEN